MRHVYLRRPVRMKHVFQCGFKKKNVKMMMRSLWDLMFLFFWDSFCIPEDLVAVCPFS